MTSTTPEAAEPPVVFRPGKKRKVYRQRSEDVDSSTAEIANEKPADASGLAPESSLESQGPHHLDQADEGLSVAEVIRRRNTRKARLGGVAFRAAPTSRNKDGGVAEDSNTDQTLAIHEGGDNAVDSSTGGIVKRFASQTGLVGELVNKHMEEYIESELARRQRHATEHAAAQSQNNSLQKGTAGPGASVAPGNPTLLQPAMRGKLLEIDLGDEVRARNIAMTERARRRLEGQGVQDEETGERPRKVRLGKDGKPWRPRDRRGSDDIKRDQLVEEFLRENRLDVYDMPAEQRASSAAVDEEGAAADDKIAEEFRREFMDAMSARRQRRRPAINAPIVKPAKAAKPEEILRGPKLGGSRNVRSAMRDLLLKEQQERR